jgi:hypothetical protein
VVAAAFVVGLATASTSCTASRRPWPSMSSWWQHPHLASETLTVTVVVGLAAASTSCTGGRFLWRPWPLSSGWCRQPHPRQQGVGHGDCGRRRRAGGGVHILESRTLLVETAVVVVGQAAAFTNWTVSWILYWQVRRCLQLGQRNAGRVGCLDVKE